jgi:2'-5' RNA ligase
VELNPLDKIARLEPNDEGGFVSEQRLATHSAVIVPVPALEIAVAEHRSQLDVAASWGVPAHVTVLYPFVLPQEIDAALLDRLERALRSAQSFDCTFGRVDWFGEDVVWVAPDPDRPFRELTEAVWAVFPECPPYGGVFDDVVPHVTVGERRHGTLAELRAAEAAVTAHLPVRTRIDRVRLIAGTDAPDSWTTVREFGLGRCNV